MNSKQRVAAALAGSGYDRLPMWYGAEPGTTQNVLDFLRLGSEEETVRRPALGRKGRRAVGRETVHCHL
jgi:hypothetical protein